MAMSSARHRSCYLPAAGHTCPEQRFSRDVWLSRVTSRLKKTASQAPMIGRLTTRVVPNDGLTNVRLPLWELLDAATASKDRDRKG